MSSIWKRVTAAGFLSALAATGMVAVSSYAQIQIEGVTGASAGASSPVVIDQPGEAPVSQPQGNTYATPSKVNPKLARIVVYRADRKDSRGVAHLEINGKYHTSLQNGGYSEVCVLPSEFILSANMVEADDSGNNGPKTSLTIDTRAQQHIYMRVQDSGDNKASITPVVEDVAQTELQKTRRQVHAATRVPDLPECVEPTDPYAPSTQGQTLSSDDLFGYGKSDIQGMSSQGRAALDKLVADIQSQRPGLAKTQIRVVGHADPIGNAQANHRLSEARAQAVRTYMVNGGLNAQRVSAEGLGANQLVVSSCGKTNTPENVECNKPNRRVVVYVLSVDR